MKLKKVLEIKYKSMLLHRFLFLVAFCLLLTCAIVATTNTELDFPAMTNPLKEFLERFAKNGNNYTNIFKH